MAGWSDVFRSDRLPQDGVKRWEMRKDLKEAHVWVTTALEEATEEIRVYNLTQERKRLAGIYARLKD